jgi:hypothetical protein
MTVRKFLELYEDVLRGTIFSKARRLENTQYFHVLNIGPIQEGVESAEKWPVIYTYHELICEEKQEFCPY